MSVLRLLQFYSDWPGFPAAGPPDAQGFHRRDGSGRWGPFLPFPHPLNRDLTDAEVRLVELDGDGIADVLITEGDAIAWHRGLGDEGFSADR